MGQPKTGGRQKGTPNTVTKQVKDALLAAFEKVGGQAYLVEVARSDPKTFCVLLGKLVPAQVKAEVQGDRIPTLVLRDFTGGAAERLEEYERWHAGNGPEPEKPNPEHLASGDDPESETTIDLHQIESGPSELKKRAKPGPDPVEPEKKLEGWLIEHPPEVRQATALMD